MSTLVKVRELQTSQPPAPPHTETLLSWLRGVIDGQRHFVTSLTAPEDTISEDPISRVDREVAQGRRKATVPNGASRAVSCAHVLAALFSPAVDSMLGEGANGRSPGGPSIQGSRGPVEHDVRLRRVLQALRPASGHRAQGQLPLDAASMAD